MSLVVRGPRVLVAPVDQTLIERPSGIVTVESSAPAVMGTVVAVGDVLDMQVGDVVLFPPSAGQRVEYGGDAYLVLYQDEPIAKWE